MTCKCENKGLYCGTKREDKLLDLSKPVQTRKGNPVKVLYTDYKSSSGNVRFISADGLVFNPSIKVIGLVSEPGGEESVHFWSSAGLSAGGRNFDLVNVKEKISGWVNIYKERIKVRPGNRVYATEAEAIVHGAHMNYVCSVYFEKEI